VIRRSARVALASNDRTACVVLATAARLLGLREYGISATAHASATPARMCAARRRGRTESASVASRVRPARRRLLSLAGMMVLGTWTCVHVHDRSSPALDVCS